jgi:thioredoxin-like negative regulator of GroEL
MILYPPALGVTRAVRSCLAVAVMFWLGGVAGAEEIHWRTDYNSARKEAAQKGLPLILDFGTQNCFWCRKLDESTFSDPAVARVINQKYVPLKIEAERDPGLVQALRIMAYPTVILAAPDGKILGTIEGFQDAVRFHDNLQRALATINNPEWMVRDFQLASKAVDSSDYARAVALLKSIVEDGKDRPVQLRSAQLLKTLETQATGRLAEARQLHERGQSAPAMDLLTAMVRTYAGTQAAGEAGQLLTRLAGEAELRAQQRTVRAREILAQARQAYRTQQYLSCLDRCEVLSTGYGDLPEGMEGSRLAGEIKNNPEWMQHACDNLSERLSGLYLELAETWIRKGQRQQAQVCLERVIQTFPGSRQAEAAQIRLSQLQGQTAQRVEYGKH